MNDLVGVQSGGLGGGTEQNEGAGRDQKPPARQHTLTAPATKCKKDILPHEQNLAPFLLFLIRSSGYPRMLDISMLFSSKAVIPDRSTNLP